MLSKGRASFLQTLIDDIKHKSDVFATFKQWKAIIEKQKGKKVKCLKTNNGIEFCSTEFDQFCKNEGIV